MKYRTLGKTDLRVSVIGIGTWQYGGEWGKDFSEAEVREILSAGRDLGLNLIDTAECYGDHTSESLIGAAISGQRDKWILATKFGHQFHSHLNRTDKRTPADMKAQLDASLRSLRTDYIDLYQYHSVRDSEFDDQDLRNALEKELKAGRIRHIGNSISNGIDPVHQASRSDWANVQALQLVYNRLERNAEKAFGLCRKQNLGVLARVPLASGLLTGKYKPGATFAANDVRAGRKQEQLDAQLAKVQKIAREEIPAGVNMAQWALAWCLRDAVVTAVIPGCKSVEQVRSNAAAADLLEETA